jgi:hypothetical protein
MKLKRDEHGHIVAVDNKPVFIADDGKEIEFDYPATLQTISRLNAEAKQHREAKEGLETKLKTFDGIEDVEKARKALEIVQNLDDKKLIEAGEVERVKQESKAAYDQQVKAIEERYKPIITERDGYKSSLFKEIVGGAFSRSKFIGEKLAIPADLVQAKFGDHFTVEGGKITAKDSSGNQIYSRARPGEIADFDEALQSIVEAYPYRDTIMKGSGASGSGASGSSNTSGGKRTVSRAAFDAMDPGERASIAKAAAAKEVVLAD